VAARRTGTRVALLAGLALAGGAASGGGSGAGSGALVLSSPAYAEGAEIPTRFTCEGEDVSPPLAWSGAPAGTRSFALIVDDPDAPDPRAPRRTWVHWVVYDLPVGVHALPEGAGSGGLLPAGARSGRNDWKRTGWGGPCPPIGRHRYVHKLFALDTVLGDLGAPDAAALVGAMEGHVLGRAELVATYQKRGP
jgi:Raf kinase inhibitor-like YbhB/YbcL family protein